VNYRHAFHAGNFADVLKHAALVFTILHLRKKATPFAVIDTHAGRGLYDLGGVEAVKTGEAAEGVGRLLPLSSIPAVLASYLTVVRGFGQDHYPGSSLIASQLLRPNDRLIAVEAQTAEHDALRLALQAYRNARTIAGDGYRELPRLLPPHERRGVILIDPPYEDVNEFARAAELLIDAHRRFATGIYILWYPAKTLPMVTATQAELLHAGIKSLIRLDLDIGKIPEREGRGPPMNATGLLVINPPFGFAQEFARALPFLAQTLAQGPGACGQIQTLAER
jgi:23S rRNA (adenine2030-N6)-methyltransferase